MIDVNPGLQERELLKLAALRTAMTGALRDRGVREPTATLAAETGGTVFHVAFQQWIAPGERRGSAAIQRETSAQLTALSASPTAGA